MDLIRVGRHRINLDRMIYISDVLITGSGPVRVGGKLVVAFAGGGELLLSRAESAALEAFLAGGTIPIRDLGAAAGDDEKQEF